MQNLEKKTQEGNSKILSSLMLIILFVSMGQSVYWQTMPIIGREFNFSEIEIDAILTYLVGLSGRRGVPAFFIFYNYS